MEIKRGLLPKLDKGFRHARADLDPERCFIVYAGEERYPKADGVEVIGVKQLTSLIAEG